MDTVIVKIESSYISLAQVKDSGGVLRVISIRRASLPESFSGAESSAGPDDIALLLMSALRNSGMTGDNIEVYLGPDLELFSEYRFSLSADDSARRKREIRGEQALLADTGEEAYRIAHYRYDGEEGDLAASAVFAASAVLCNVIVAALEREGYNVRTLSSSLIAFAEIAKTVSDIGARVLVVSSEKKEFQIALFTEGRLARLARFAGGTDTSSSAEALLPFITDETKVVLCGFESQDARIRESLKKAGAAAVGSVNQKMKGPRGMLKLSGELAYQEKLFPGIFSSVSAGPPASASSYLPESKKKRKPNSAVIATCIVAFLVALFICAVPPLTLMSAEREHAYNKVILQDPFFADAAEKLSQYRTLVSEYTEIMQSGEEVPARDSSYAEVIDEIRGGLLLTATIDEMFYEKGNGLFVDFIIEDENLEIFNLGKNTLNRNNKMTVYEPSERVELDDGLWRIQIRVTQTPKPGEVLE